jgi:hypothetical protein
MIEAHSCKHKFDFANSISLLNGRMCSCLKMGVVCLLYLLLLMMCIVLFELLNIAFSCAADNYRTVASAN